MKVLNTLILMFSLINLCSCNSNTWFGNNKKLDMPGERISITAKSKDLIIENYDSFNQSYILPQLHENIVWNGSFNQFTGKNSNLKWHENYTPSSINYSSNTYLIQPSIPVIEKDKIFFESFDGTISAYDLVTNTEIWKNNTFCNEDNKGFFDFSFDKFLSGGLSKDQDILYATVGITKIAAINALSGENIWITNFSSPIRSIPLILKELVIVQSIDNKIYALNKKDGEIIWTHLANIEDITALSTTNLSLVGNNIIAKFSNDELVSIDKDTGEEIWSNNLVNKQEFGYVTRSNFNINNSFFIENNYIITANSRGYLLKIDLANGTTIWAKNLDATGKGWLSNGVYYLVSNKNNLMAINTHNGSPFWVIDLNVKDSNDKLISDLYISNPVMINNHILILNNIGNLFELNAQNGEIIKTTEIGKDVYLGPLVANQRMYIVSNSGNLYYY